MIRFDWEVLKESPVKTILGILYVLTDAKTIQNAPSTYLHLISKFSVKSAFLINPIGLILNKGRHTENDMFVYLELASMRSYNNYRKTGSKRLPIHYIEHLFDLDRLKLNTCLDVTNEEIIFIYEET